MNTSTQSNTVQYCPVARSAVEDAAWLFAYFNEAADKRLFAIAQEALFHPVASAQSGIPRKVPDASDAMFDTRATANGKNVEDLLVQFGISHAFWFFALRSAVYSHAVLSADPALAYNLSPATPLERSNVNRRMWGKSLDRLFYAAGMKRNGWYRGGLSTPKLYVAAMGSMREEANQWAPFAEGLRRELERAGTTPGAAPAARAWVLGAIGMHTTQTVDNLRFFVFEWQLRHMGGTPDEVVKYVGHNYPKIGAGYLKDLEDALLNVPLDSSFYETLARFIAPTSSMLTTEITYGYGAARLTNRPLAPQALAKHKYTLPNKP